MGFNVILLFTGHSTSICLSIVLTMFSLIILGSKMPLGVFSQENLYEAFIFGLTICEFKLTYSIIFPYCIVLEYLLNMSSVHGAF